jgi:hypothetical protein
MLLNSALAMVFLGGPNPRDEADDSTNMVLATLLAVNSKLPKHTLAKIKEGLHILVNVSRLFQDIQLNIEILSLVESAPTKVKIGRRDKKFSLSSSRKMIVCISSQLE